jgi:hypothetical protein
MGIFHQCDKAWIEQIAFMRNAHDINHGKQGFSLEIENFKLNPGNKFSTPGWRFDFSAKKEGATQTYYSDIYSDMDIHLTNLLTFFEDLLLILIIDSSDDNYKFKIYKKSAEAIDEKCPSVYFVSSWVFSRKRFALPRKMATLSSSLST